MKKNILVLSFIMFVLCVQAHMSTQTKNALPDSTIIEGFVKDMSDGTRLELARMTNSSMLERLHDSIIVKGGKFRVVIHPEKKSEVYYLMHYGGMHTIFVEQGKDIRIIGDGNHCLKNWIVESKNLFQQEDNAYTQFIKNNLPDYYDIDNKVTLAYEKRFDATLSQEDRDRYTDYTRTHRGDVDALRIKYNAALLDFMKDRPFSERMKNELHMILMFDKNFATLEQVGEILKKIPEEFMNDPIVQELFATFQNRRVKVGEQMADFSLFDRKGKTHKLSEFKGRCYTILEFTSKGCIPCQIAKPELNALYLRQMGKMELIAISEDSQQIWKNDEEMSYHEWNDYKYAVDLKTAYNVSAFPTYIIIDSNGKVLEIIEGTNLFYQVLLKYIPDVELEKLLNKHNHK